MAIRTASVLRHRWIVLGWHVRYCTTRRRIALTSTEHALALVAHLVAAYPTSVLDSAVAAYLPSVPDIAVAA
eukprot:223394-Rhodomonas_salina.7